MFNFFAMRRLIFTIVLCCFLLPFGWSQCDNPTISTFAGTGSSGSVNGSTSIATFSGPFGVTADNFGNIYVTEWFNRQIRKISPTGVVSIFAGMMGVSGNMDGIGAAATFRPLTGITTDNAGNVYVTDRFNHSIRKITPTGVVTTFAGTGAAGNTDGIGIAASFWEPNGITTDPSGNLYVVEVTNHQVRKITPAGVVTTFAGTGAAGNTDGIGTAASFNTPAGITTDAAGNIYVADFSNHQIRKITPTGVVTTLAGSGVAGSTDGVGTAASFNKPTGIVTDAAGNIYVTDDGGHIIRKISPAGVVTTIAGLAGVTGNTNGTAASARFRNPTGITVDIDGNLLISDFSNNMIRKIENCIVIPTTNTSIPTMNQWGLMIFGLLIMNLSVFFVQFKELV